MISKELENKKKEYYKLYDRYVKAEKWFCNQDNNYFNNVEDKKEYKAFFSLYISIIQFIIFFLFTF